MNLYNLIIIIVSVSLIFSFVDYLIKRLFNQLFTNLNNIIENFLID